ncbi:hypothetical protein RZS08_43195, partial [Arthrospira platensis SPKY1]|nr:hypothetical protein [Arthrospira platensis SPKY1]
GFDNDKATMDAMLGLVLQKPRPPPTSPAPCWTWRNRPASHRLPAAGWASATPANARKNPARCAT